MGQLSARETWVLLCVHMPAACMSRFPVVREQVVHPNSDWVTCEGGAELSAEFFSIYWWWLGQVAICLRLNMTGGEFKAEAGCWGQDRRSVDFDCRQCKPCSATCPWNHRAINTYIIIKSNCLSINRQSTPGCLSTFVYTPKQYIFRTLKRSE